MARTFIICVTSIGSAGQNTYDMRICTKLTLLCVFVASFVSCGGKVRDKTIEGLSEIVKVHTAYGHSGEERDRQALVKRQKDFRNFYSKLGDEDYAAFLSGYNEYADNEFKMRLYSIIGMGDAVEAAYFTTFLYDLAEKEQDYSLAKEAKELSEVCYYCDNYSAEDKKAARDIIDAWKAGKKAEAERRSSPEYRAEKIMEAFYKAVVAQDFDAYCEVDYEAGEIDGFTDDEWKRYNAAEQQWKKENAKKWKAIKQYRQKKISEGCVFSITDID